MIIGNGMLAKKFATYKDNCNILIFASGVSNSKETNPNEFYREFQLLEETIKKYPSMHFVYFSTSSMYDPMSKLSLYVEHKIKMERYIQTNVNSYNIFRISQIIGRAKNETLVNFLVNNILNELEFSVWLGATRNLISVEDVFLIIDYILKNQLMKNQLINIANSNTISVIDFINIVEEVLGKKAKINMVSNGMPFDTIDINDLKPIIKALKINFDSKEYYKVAISELI